MLHVMYTIPLTGKMNVTGLRSCTGKLPMHPDSSPPPTPFPEKKWLLDLSGKVKRK